MENNRQSIKVHNNTHRDKEADERLRQSNERQEKIPNSLYRLVSFIIALLLLIGVFELPIGYYSYLRCAVCIYSFASAYSYFTRKKRIIPIVFLAVGILFNPIILITMTKASWVIIDIISAIFVIIAGIYFYKTYRSL